MPPFLFVWNQTNMKYVFLIWLLLTFSGPLWLLISRQVDLTADYTTANRDSAGFAPSPEITSEAVIQVYAARAFNWRGAFASHCWIAVKPRSAARYTVYQVVGWRAYRGLPALVVGEDIPDRNWFNEAPQIILDIRGEKAAKLIPKLDEVARQYPYAASYRVWPGPNSNTFPAYIARQIPELGLALPADAVGKDLLVNTVVFARAPSGTGYQISLFGVFGILIAQKEGIEINLFGLVYGIRFTPFKILVPGWG